MRMLPHIGTYLLQRTEHQNLAYSGAAGARLGSATDRGCRRRRHRDIATGFLSWDPELSVCFEPGSLSSEN